jgi:hypothetical protein
MSKLSREQSSSLSIIHNHHHHHHHHHDYQEDLRLLSEKESRLPKLFARIMGEADAAALTRPNSDVFMRRWSDVGATCDMVDTQVTIKGDVCVQSSDSMAPSSWTMLRCGSLPQEIFRRNLS